MFRNRAEWVARKAADADLPKLRDDVRWESIISPGVSGIASVDVDGYLAPGSVDALARDFLLMPADADANVIIHILPKGQNSFTDSKLLLAVDLADQRGPREELRAAGLLRENRRGAQGVQAMIVLPPMPPEQRASWLGVLDLYDKLPAGWTLIGGQLVHQVRVL
jgi:hypothetical protein